MLFQFIALFALLGVTMAATEQTCIWKDGSTATGYLPCTNSTATSGSCCLSGESCLGSGLCYGNIGLVYRGACINTWGEDCPTYCDDINSEWANLFPCPFANSGSQDGPQSWWCGAQGTTVCTSSNESHFITMLPSVATKLLIPSSTASAVTVTVTSTPPSATSSISSTKSSSTSTLSTGSSSAQANTNQSQSSTATSTSDQSHQSNTGTVSVTTNNGTAIGLGVGLGGLLLACVGLGAWAYQSYRRQKKMLEHMNTSMNQPGNPMMHQTKPELSGYSGYGVYREMGGPQPTELDSGRAELAVK